MLPGKKFPNFLQFSDEIFQKRNCINFSETLCAETSNLILFLKKKLFWGSERFLQKLIPKLTYFIPKIHAKQKKVVLYQTSTYELNKII